jgi:aminopeptidase N
LTREIDMDTSVIAGRVALINAEADSVNAAVAEAIK